MSTDFDRRGLLRLLAGSAATALLPPLTGCARSGEPGESSVDVPSFPRREEFAAAADGEGWARQWISPGVATLRREGGLGVMEAGSDIFPNDPRPVAFVLDGRMLEGRISAQIAQAGSMTGLVLRRQSPRDCYAAVYDTDLNTLSIRRRSGFDLVTLASTPVLPTVLLALEAGRTLLLEFSAQGAAPTTLHARLSGGDGLSYEVSAQDDARALQRPGDAGVLTQSDTLLPDTNVLLPALGNVHLLPYTVQEGQAFFDSPAGQILFGTMRRRSTARFAGITVESAETPRPTPASVFAATTGAPIEGGVVLQVASDLPAQVSFEMADNEDFSGSGMIDGGRTDAYDAVARDVGGLAPGTHWWRPRLRRAGLETLGPKRSFRVLPPAGDPQPVSLVYGSCGSQFNAIFDRIAERRPDVFIWQGDLNYPDAHGPLAQNLQGYAGAWRHFLDNPRIAPILERCSFVAGRDDHDYGVQDSNAANLRPWGVAPWESLMNPRTYHRFTAGLLEVWVLDQRKFKDDPTLPDTPEKSLLGMQQRQWLFDGLRASTAPFKLICSPATLAPSGVANARDGSWAAGFTAERDLLLQHLRDKVSGQAAFLSGDTHFTMLWQRDGLFEQRACPLDIPPPNDVSIANPDLELGFGNTPGVVYWSRRSHFSVVSVGTEAGRPLMTIELVRDDGVTVQSTRFE